MANDVHIRHPERNYRMRCVSVAQLPEMLEGGWVVVEPATKPTRKVTKKATKKPKVKK